MIYFDSDVWIRQPFILAAEGMPKTRHKMKLVRSLSEKKTLTICLRKIEGQVEAIERMVEADADCADTLMRVVSARRALKSVGEKVLTSHIHACIECASNRSDSGDRFLSLITVLERYVD